jgi:hypothetical protein
MYQDIHDKTRRTSTTTRSIQAASIPLKQFQHLLILDCTNAFSHTPVEWTTSQGINRREKSILFGARSVVTAIGNNGIPLGTLS